jgi:hypothetical protein
MEQAKKMVKIAYHALDEKKLKISKSSTWKESLF